MEVRRIKQNKVEEQDKLFRIDKILWYVTLQKKKQPTPEIEYVRLSRRGIVVF